jgi:hypothetical protein
MGRCFCFGPIARLAGREGATQDMTRNGRRDGVRSFLLEWAFAARKERPSSQSDVEGTMGRSFHLWQTAKHTAREGATQELR